MHKNHKLICSLPSIPATEEKTTVEFKFDIPDEDFPKQINMDFLFETECDGNYIIEPLGDGNDVVVELKYKFEIAHENESNYQVFKE